MDKQSRLQTMTSPPKTEPFARHHQRYERWFERHDLAYRLRRKTLPFRAGI
jgi:hypothetical protein